MGCSKYLFLIAVGTGMVWDVAGALVVSEYQALAHANAYAPLDRSQYFETHVVQHTSPANPLVDANWTGTNIGGTINTWHWIGHAEADVVTGYTSDRLEIAGAGTFSYDLTTTADFVHIGGLRYGPGSATEYYCTFSIDVPSFYAASADLIGSALTQLYSVSTQSYVFNVHQTSLSQPSVVNKSGTIPPGVYTCGFNTGAGGTVNQGASHWTDAGNVTNFVFTVQAPEPSAMIAFPAAALAVQRRRFGRDPVYTRH